MLWVDIPVNTTNTVASVVPTKHIGPSFTAVSTSGTFEVISNKPRLDGYDMPKLRQWCLDQKVLIPEDLEYNGRILATVIEDKYSNNIRPLDQLWDPGITDVSIKQMIENAMPSLSNVVQSDSPFSGSKNNYHQQLTMLCKTRQIPVEFIYCDVCTRLLRDRNYHFHSSSKCPHCVRRQRFMQQVSSIIYFEDTEIPPEFGSYIRSVYPQVPVLPHQCSIDYESNGILQMHDSEPNLPESDRIIHRQQTVRRNLLINAIIAAFDPYFSTHQYEYFDHHQLSMRIHKQSQRYITDGDTKIPVFNCQTSKSRHICLNVLLEVLGLHIKKDEASSILPVSYIQYISLIKKALVDKVHPILLLSLDTAMKNETTRYNNLQRYLTLTEDEEGKLISNRSNELKLYADYVPYAGKDAFYTLLNDIQQKLGTQHALPVCTMDIIENDPDNEILLTSFAFKEHIRKEMNLTVSQLEYLVHNIDIETDKDPLDPDIKNNVPEYSQTQWERLKARRCITSMIHMKPQLFPDSLWDYVFDSEKPKVMQRWSKFNEQASPGRLAEVIKQIDNIDISKENPERSVEANFFRAQCYANINRYAHPDLNNIPKMKGREYDIILNDTSPCMAKMRRTTILENSYMHWRLKQLVGRGIIQISKSAYNSPPICVPYAANIAAFMEKHGDDAMEKIWQEEYKDDVLKFFRLVNDFRNLNEKTKLERWPLPYIVDLLDKMKGSSRYSTEDIEDAFYTVNIKDEHRPFTAFSTPYGHYEYVCMGQGLKNAANFFAHMVYEMFSDLSITGKAITVYQDDICNYADDLEEHLDLQQRIYDIMEENCLVFKPSKAHLNYTTQRILGHIMSNKGRAPDPKLIESITKIAAPTTLEGVRSLLGLAQVAREYLHGLSSLLEPIQKLARKNANIQANWGIDQDNALIKLKEALTTAPVLAMPDVNKKFRIHVDACRIGRGIGAILLQQDEEILAREQREHWRPIAYWSRSLSKEERRYSATELECTALHDSILHWKIYLQCGQAFEVIVDHYALAYMVTKMGTIEANRRLTTLCLDLQGYRFTVIHRKGGEHLDADAVSRLLHVGEPAIVYSEDDLRDDIGPLSKEDQQLLENKFGSLNATVLENIIDRHREEVHQEVKRVKEQSMNNLLEAEISTIDQLIPVTTNSNIPTIAHTNQLSCSCIEDMLCAPIRFSTRSTKGIAAKRLDDTVHNGKISKQVEVYAQKQSKINDSLKKQHQEAKQNAADNVQYQQAKVRQTKVIKMKNKLGNTIETLVKKMNPKAILSRDIPIAISSDAIEVRTTNENQQVVPVILPLTNEIRNDINSVAQLENPTGRNNKLKVIQVPKHKPRPPSRLIEDDIRNNRRQELISELLSDYDYLVQEHFIDPDDSALCVVINTFHDKKLDKLRATVIPLDAVLPATIQSSLFRIRDIIGVEGVQYLVKRFHEVTNGDRQRWPRTKEEWLTIQQNDNILSNVLARFNNDQQIIILTKNDDHYSYIKREFLDDGVTLGPLIRIQSTKHEVKNGRLTMSYKEEFKQSVIPESHIQWLLQLFHEGMGHPGINRMRNSMRQQYYWSTMNNDIQQFCQGCHYCKARKPNTDRGKIPILGYFLSERPWQRVHADCATGFPISDKNSNTAVLILKCALTKWVEIVPIKEVNAYTVTSAFIEVFSTHGVPEYLVTDNGTEFSNVMLTDVLKVLASNHMHTSPINPQANGQAENAVKTFKNMLSSYISKDQRNWDEYVCLVKMQYNSTVNMATGFSPYFMMYGREMQQPCESYIHDMYREQEDKVHIEAYVEKLTKTLMLLWELVGEETLMKTEHYNKAMGIDVNIDKLRSFEVGDYVYVRRIPRRFYKDNKENINYHINAKLQPCRWVGAFRILSKVSPVTYVLDIHNQEKVIHIRHLKPASKISLDRRAIEEYRRKSRLRFINSLNKTVNTNDIYADLSEEFEDIQFSEE